MQLALLFTLVAQMVKCLPAMRETRVQFLGWEDPLEKAMAIHSSTLAWKIPWMEEPDRLQSMGSQRVRHDWATSLHFTGKLLYLIPQDTFCSYWYPSKKSALVYELFTFYYIGFIHVVVIQDPLYFVLLNYLLLNTLEIHDLWEFVSPFKG